MSSASTPTSRALPSPHAPQPSSALTNPTTVPQTSNLSSTASQLPSPAALDVLPALHALLSRLVPDPTSTSLAPPLEPQHLASEAAGLKVRLQKAKAAIEQLPDMERSITQQEKEMQQVEARIREQRDVLRGLVGRVSPVKEKPPGQDAMEE
ncbi:MAG: hypothetical protein M1817_004248 [Caeruleum heppii]|nr:MAG: hypothetical protein M1817_004248 [Caeruleum heppii]